MKDFQLALPASLDEAVAFLPTDEQGERTVRLMAGGQDLLTEMKEHLVEPDLVVSLHACSDLGGIRDVEGGGLELGALVTLEELESDPRVTERYPVIAEAAHSVASPQIRTVGTLGGNLNQRPRCWYFRHEAAPCLKKGGATCFAKEGRNKYNAILGGGPSYIVHPSDLAPALVSLEAEVELVGSEGARRMPLEDYFITSKEGGVETETVRKPDEVLSRVFVPAVPDGHRSTYLKFKERASYDFALSAVAMSLTMDGARIGKARIALGGVAPKPWRPRRAEAELAGKALAEIDERRVAELALQGAKPLAENGYKVPLTQGLVIRALRSLSR